MSWTYPKTLTIIDPKLGKVSWLTETYQIGIYVATYLGDDPIPMQGSATPNQIEKQMKANKKKAIDEGYKYSEGRMVTIIEEDGFFKEQEL